MRLFRTDGGLAIDGSSRPTTRRKTTPLSSLASTAGRLYTGVVWALGALAIVLLLLAFRQAGSYQDLFSTVVHGASVEAAMSAHGTASLPFLLGALAALAAAFGLLAIRVTVEQLWEEAEIGYQRALKNWNSAYYCPTDRIVFIRTVTAACWEPVEELRRLIAQSEPNPLG